MELFWMKLGLLTYGLILFLVITLKLIEYDEDYFPAIMIGFCISVSSALGIFTTYSLLNILMGV